MFSLLKNFICDNASIMNTERLKDLSAMSGSELKSTGWWPADHKPTAVLNELSNVLQTHPSCYLEQRGGSSKHSRVQSLPLARLAWKDLPGGVSGYSPHSLLFGRDPVG